MSKNQSSDRILTSLNLYNDFLITLIAFASRWSAWNNAANNVLLALSVGNIFLCPNRWKLMSYLGTFSSTRSFKIYSKIRVQFFSPNIHTYFWDRYKLKEVWRTDVKLGQKKMTWGQFHQHFTSSFYMCRAQKHRKDGQLKQLFALSGSACIKSCV